MVGLTAAETTTIRRAGLLHDLGRLGVSSSIWEKPGPLTDVERERAHLHPYLTDKMLMRISNHVEHIYTKLGVGSRASATLYATQHGLVGSFTAQP